MRFVVTYMEGDQEKQAFVVAKSRGQAKRIFIQTGMPFHSMVSITEVKDEGEDKGMVR